ncbi:MAG: hypothetical protein K2Q26_15460 [Bdellovibrionales bacterium]|nr:hypothetical protein [Bdellovibrionales bacterium]
MKLLLTLSNDATKSVEVEGEILIATWNERYRFGAQKMIFPLVLAIGSIFIPVLHFVLTPLLIVVVLISFWLGFRNQWKLAVYKPAKCVSCRQTLDLPAYVANDRKAVCLHCTARYIF